MEKVTVGVVNFNGKKCLPATIQAIKHLDYSLAEVIVVDNGSTDGSREWVEENHPDIRCISLRTNIGLPGARNVILQSAKTDYVFILDNDITVNADVLTHLMEFMTTVPRAAVCHPELHDPNDPFVYHYNGGWGHYLAAHLSRSKPDPTVKRLKYEVFDMVSGAALLINRAAAKKIGWFDADYFFNIEDGDFTTRLTLAGYLCLNIPAAMVRHEGKPRGTSKVFYQIRNRWYFILKLYSWRTIILVAPMFAVFELSQALFCFTKGAILDYLKGNIAVLREIPKILKKRREFQKLKVKQDREWLTTGDIYVPEHLLNNRIFRMFKILYCGLFNLYWKLVRPFC